MKRILLFTFCLLFPLILNVVADDIPTRGHWDDEDYSRRSTPAPARPEASINGSVVSIYSPDALDNLNVTITDLNGIILFRESFSFIQGENIDMPISLNSGEYIIVMTHYWRYLMGEFEVN